MLSTLGCGRMDVKNGTGESQRSSQRMLTSLSPSSFSRQVAVHSGFFIGTVSGGDFFFAVASSRAHSFNSDSKEIEGLCPRGQNVTAPMFNIVDDGKTTLGDVAETTRQIFGVKVVFTNVGFERKRV